MEKIISANSPEFLDPIYKTLDEEKTVVMQFALANCGGCRNEYLVKSREELDKLREKTWYAWRPRAIVTAAFNPVVVWDGPIVFETSKLLWDEPRQDFDYCEKVDGIINCLDYEKLLEDKGKDVIVIREVKWREEEHYAYVPMADGTIKPGAY